MGHELYGCEIMIAHIQLCYVTKLQPGTYDLSNATNATEVVFVFLSDMRCVLCGVTAAKA